jgi:hypothetical protein
LFGVILATWSAFTKAVNFLAHHPHEQNPFYNNPQWFIGKFTALVNALHVASITPNNLPSKQVDGLSRELFSAGMDQDPATYKGHLDMRFGFRDGYEAIDQFANDILDFGLSNKFKEPMPKDRSDCTIL